MRVLILSTSTNNVETVIDSLEYAALRGAFGPGSDGAPALELQQLRYDERWIQECAAAVMANPGVADELNAGRWPAPEHREAVRERVSRDEHMLNVASEFKPDLIVYISAWEGLFVPKDETLAELNQRAPVVHMCFDASDPPWWPQMKRFEAAGCFALTVNIDGGHEWPGGRRWPMRYNSATDAAEAAARGEDFFIQSAITLLTPCDPRFFAGFDQEFVSRPYRVAFAGNNGGWIRSGFIQRFQTIKGFAFRPRDGHLNAHQPGAANSPSKLSYQNYIDFLKRTQISISIPFSGSNAAKQVKGRVVESALAGACVLDMKSAAMRDWFIPRFEYGEYESADEAIEQAEWLAGHPRVSAEMAAAMRERVRREHSPEVFWSRVIQAVPARVAAPSTVVIEGEAGEHVAANEPPKPELSGLALDAEMAHADAETRGNQIETGEPTPLVVGSGIVLEGPDIAMIEPIAVEEAPQEAPREVPETVDETLVDEPAPVPAEPVKTATAAD